jgi:peptidyl-tRNA hydrolase, PTH1 family
MKLIVGLGNPGTKYESTKHNLGFMVVEQFLKDVTPVKNSNWTKDDKLKSEVYIFDYQPKKGDAEKVVLAKPLTYMNNSGMAVSLIANYYKIKPTDIWVIHDELDLPLGSMKIRFGGGTAGHHGLDSILAALKTDKFWRFRIGIGEQKSKTKVKKIKVKPMDEFVLGNFYHSDKGKIKNIIKKSSKALETALEKGIESSQNQFNTK